MLYTGKKALNYKSNNNKLLNGERKRRMPDTHSKHNVIDLESSTIVLNIFNFFFLHLTTNSSSQIDLLYTLNSMALFANLIGIYIFPKQHCKYAEEKIIEKLDN